jgi:hypothetical protein
MDPEVKNAVDIIRAREERALRGEKEATEAISRETVNVSFSGHGVLIVAQETVNDEVPLCLGLGDAKNQVRMHDSVSFFLFESILY